MQRFIYIAILFILPFYCTAQQLQIGPEIAATYSFTGLQLQLGAQGKIGQFNFGLGPRVNLTRMAQASSGPWGLYSRVSYLPSGYRAKRISGTIDFTYAMTVFPATCPSIAPCNSTKKNIEYEVGLGYGLIWWPSDQFSMKSQVMGSMLRRSYYNPITREHYRTNTLQPIISLGAGWHW